VSISFDLAPGASLDDAVDDIKKAEDDIGLPETFTTAYQGALSAFQRSLSNELYLIVAAVAAVYIVLGLLYESFAHPITIIDASVGGRRRASGAQYRGGWPRHHRHCAPDRNREEKCDHDDRLRARGAARRG
jgi:hypothetical protein